MPLQATSGAASYDAFGGGVPFEPTYIEQIFSTFLYTGNGSTQTITNGIDLAGKGGLVWTKSRNNAISHALIDTARGIGRILNTNNTEAQSSVTTDTTAALTAFNANGYTLGSDSGNWGTNFSSGYTYASWTFRKQPKFFDVVTWTGDSASSRTIQHSLGSTPGCIIIKRTSAADSWWVVHRSAPGGFDGYGALNSASAFISSGSGVSSVNETSFTVNSFYNGNSSTTWVAYLFAHNAGGFGLTGTDNVISCGSFTTDGSGNATVNLGYEPQWVLSKRSDGTGDWRIWDSMRGFYAAPGEANPLSPNTSDAENVAFYNPAYVNSSGFSVASFGASRNFIYIAIRRGPMKVPTTGTSVFGVASASSRVATFANRPDWLLFRQDLASSAPNEINDRLRGGKVLATNSTGSEYDATGTYSITLSNTTATFGSSWPNTPWNVALTRAPGFFDEVCYTGTGSTTTFAHNLGVKPELIIFKARSSSSVGNWPTHYYLPDNTSTFGRLSTTDAFSASALTATSTTFEPSTNSSGVTCVAYLFASCPGVSKVFSYTGNGSSQTINCGFTGGARFVMVKRTDSTGNWLVVDTARGLVSAGDPTLYLNSTAAEVTGVDWIDPDNSGFIVNQEGTMNANVSSATYIGLAIA
jgi:hypothetical protein